MGTWIYTAVFTSIVSYLACKQAMKLAQGHGMIALPGERQSHREATPTGGGLGLVFSVVLTGFCLQLLSPLPAFWWQNVIPGLVVLSIVGWLDDKHAVSSLIRLLVQLAVSLWVIGFGWSEFSLAGLGLFAGAAVAMVWMMNMYNFMDGSNGMAAFQGVFAGLVLAVLFQNGGQSEMSVLALVIAAACAGFLPLNFPNARVFMGDVASVPLGFVFAAFMLYGVRTGSLSLASSLLVMSLFIVDATLTLLKRVIRGERWYTAHAQHVYQRLIAHGWSHGSVLLLYLTINIVWVLPGLILAEKYQSHAALTAGVSFLVLSACWYTLNRRLGMIVTEQVK